MKRFLPYLALLGSMGTLFCCVLPAVFVMLGAGATFAGLVSAVPQIVWLSEHKAIVFGTAAVLLALSALMQWRARNLPCPTDPALAAACKTGRKVSIVVLGIAVALYLTGGFFAFVLPRLTE